MASKEKVEHDCIICASVLGTNGGTLTLLCGKQHNLRAHHSIPLQGNACCSNFAACGASSSSHRTFYAWTAREIT